MASQLRRSARGHIPRADGEVFTLADLSSSDDDEDYCVGCESDYDDETPEEREARLAEEAALENSDVDKKPAAPKKCKANTDEGAAKKPKAEVAEGASTTKKCSAIKKPSSTVFVNGPGTVVLNQGPNITVARQSC